MSKRQGKDKGNEMVDVTPVNIALNDEEMAMLRDVVAEKGVADKKLTDEKYAYNVFREKAQAYGRVSLQLRKDGYIEAKDPRNPFISRRMTPADLRAIKLTAPTLSVASPDGGLTLNLGPHLVSMLERAASLEDGFNRITSNGKTWDKFHEWLRDTLMDALINERSGMDARALQEEENEVFAESDEAPAPGSAPSPPSAPSAPPA